MEMRFISQVRSSAARHADYAGSTFLSKVEMMHPQNYIHIRAEAARLEAAANLRDTTGLAFVPLVPAHRSSAMQRPSTLKSFQPIGLVSWTGAFALIALSMSLCVTRFIAG